MPGYDKVGGDASSTESATHQTGIRIMEAMAEFFEAENTRHQSDHQTTEVHYEHLLKIKRQYLIIRWVISFLAITIPPVLLFYVVRGALLNNFEKLHAVAQALLISGSITTFVVLYGVVLHHVYKGHTPRDAFGGTPDKQGATSDDNNTGDESFPKKQMESMMKAIAKGQQE